jgi:hypothetical protein
VAQSSRLKITVHPRARRENGLTSRDSGSSDGSPPAPAENTPPQPTGRAVYQFTPRARGEHSGWNLLIYLPTFAFRRSTSRPTAHFQIHSSKIIPCWLSASSCLVMACCWRHGQQ